MIIWDPEWLGLVHGAPDSPEALHDVCGDAESITSTRQVEGSIFSMWDQESYSFEWDVASASGTLSLLVNDPEAFDPFKHERPYLRVGASNVRGMRVGTVNDGGVMSLEVCK